MTHEQSGEALRISVRRFRAACGVSLSLLPEFCQPYRLVCNEAIEDFFDEQAIEGATEEIRRPWRDLLVRYWRRYRQWYGGKVRGMGPGLLACVGAAWGRAPPDDPRGYWCQIMEACGCLCQTTRLLIQEHKVTLFGRYQCHQSRDMASGK